MDGLLMSSKEQKRARVLQQIEDRCLTQKKAAEQLGISARQVRRLVQAYREKGMEGIVSKRRGKASNNRLNAKIMQQALDLIKEKYSDFGATLAHEKLKEIHQIEISRESVRQLMIAEGVWKPQKAKLPAIHQMRERRACLGELVQIDGSDHDWFEGRGPRCTLLVYIDDATGRLMELLFVASESFFSYCAATRRYIERHGKPIAFYSDKHGVFRVNIPNNGTGDNLTQFGRAMQELDIQIICANTPQAKGRVERANQTLQDRLVKELRLRGISDIASANLFLAQYIDDYNRRFAVVPRSQRDIHRPLREHENLDLILIHKENRILTKNLTLQFDNVVYQIQTNRPAYALRKTHVIVCENHQGEITILYKGTPLDYSVFHKQSKQAEIVTAKDIGQVLSKAHTPAPNHPWRRSPIGKARFKLDTSP